MQRLSGGSDEIEALSTDTTADLTLGWDDDGCFFFFQKKNLQPPGKTLLRRGAQRKKNWVFFFSTSLNSMMLRGLRGGEILKCPVFFSEIRTKIPTRLGVLCGVAGWDSRPC